MAELPRGQNVNNSMRKFLLFMFAAAPAWAGADSLAEAFFKNQAYSLAAEAWKADLERSGAFAPEARLGLGQSYQRLGDFKRAALCYSDFLDEHPSHSRAPEAWLGLGVCRQAQRDYEGSQRALSEFLANYAAHPLAPQAAFASAENLYDLGHYQEAEE